MVTAGVGRGLGATRVGGPNSRRGVLTSIFGMFNVGIFNFEIVLPAVPTAACNGASGFKVGSFGALTLPVRPLTANAIPANTPSLATATTRRCASETPNCSAGGVGAKAVTTESTLETTTRFAAAIGEEIPIHAVLGDQQAAAVGQTCFEKGAVKSTYGTGAFAIMNTGNKKILSKNKLLTTICYRLKNKNTYALEGSIFIAGAGVQWLRDKIRLIDNAYETEKIAKSKKSNDGIYVVPAFTGLGAPYWNSESRGLITGLTRNSDWKNLVRAVIESVAYQSYDLFEAMRKDGSKPKLIKVDGGMVANNWFAQFFRVT